eukprot:3083198-Alexandrium_andersonii.AAC.1
MRIHTARVASCFSSWIVEQATKKVGALHAWTKQDVVPQAWGFEEPTLGVLGPGQRVESRRKLWHDRWTRDQQSHGKILQ